MEYTTTNERQDVTRLIRLEEDMHEVIHLTEKWRWRYEVLDVLC